MKLQSVAKQVGQEGIKIGSVYEKATVEKELYGGSYRVKIGKDQIGFLHKTHTQDTKSTEEESDD
jgi:hypothetical protein